MMNSPLYDLDQPGLQLEVNSYKPGNGLIWPILFPLKFTPKFDLKGIEGDEGIPVSADRVSFDTKAPKKTRRKVGTWSGELGKISISRERNEKEINDYNDLQTIAAANPEDSATAQYLVNVVYNDVQFCNDGMDYKVEIDALRIGSLGKQTFPASIEGDMATSDEINFNIPEDNFMGAAKVWSDSTADGIADIAKAQKAIAKKGLKKPLFAFVETSAMENLLAQEKTMKRVASVLINISGLTSTEVLSVDNINAYMRKKGYPQFIVLDSYATIQDKKGKDTTIKPWNEKVITMSPVPRLGYTYYKPVPKVQNCDALQEYGSYYKMTVYSDLNPMLEVTMAEAYVQCGLTNRSSLVFMNTENTTWNGGE